jgi:hypothetical protein
VSEILHNPSPAKWIKTTFFGWFLGIILILVLSSLFDAIGIEGFQFFLGIGIGAGVGFMQGRLLRTTAFVNKPWLWTSIIGMGLPFMISDLLILCGDLSLGSYYIPVCIASGSVLVSVLQYLYLKKASSKAMFWILGCSLGWMLAGITVFAVDYTMRIIDHVMVGFFVNLSLILGGGAVLGLVTSPFLRVILRQDNLS